MFSLDEELRELQRVDSRIARVQELISAVEQEVAMRLTHRGQAALGQQTVLALVCSLEQLRDHRGLLERIIDDLQRGRLPGM